MNMARDIGHDKVDVWCRDCEKPTWSERKHRCAHIAEHRVIEVDSFDYMFSLCADCGEAFDIQKVSAKQAAAIRRAELRAGGSR